MPSIICTFPYILKNYTLQSLLKSIAKFIFLCSPTALSYSLSLYNPPKIMLYLFLHMDIYFFLQKYLWYLKLCVSRYSALKHHNLFFQIKFLNIKTFLFPCVRHGINPLASVPAVPIFPHCLKYGVLTDLLQFCKGEGKLLASLLFKVILQPTIFPFPFQLLFDFLLRNGVEQVNQLTG